MNTTFDRMDDVVRAAEESLPAERGEALGRFVRVFYDLVPDQDLFGSAEELCASARGIWELAQQRKPNEARLRVYNPSLEEHDWRPNETLVEVVNDDMPFLVDSVSAALASLGCEIRLIIHPIVRAERDPLGRLVELHDLDSEEGEPESWMQVHMRRRPQARHAEIEGLLEQVLGEVRAAVGDWQAMRDRCQAVIERLESAPPPLPAEEVEEGIAFLRWLEDDNFTFLGVREYRFEGEGHDVIGEVVPDRGLGTLRDDSRVIFEGMRHLDTLPDEVREFVREARLVRITKANAVSRVHRPVHQDVISVKSFDESGQVIGEVTFVGLFTSASYSARVSEVPILRQRVARTIETLDFPQRSHNAKVLQHILESLPRDELFQMTQPELDSTALSILQLQQRQQIALLVRVDPFERFVSCLVYVPRERYDTDLRKRVQAILEEAFDATARRHYTLLTDAPLARLHMILKTTPGRLPPLDLAEVERRLIEAAESWSQRLELALVERLGENEGLVAHHRYKEAFPAGYREHFDASEAANDVVALERLLAGRDLTLRVYRSQDQPEEEIELKVFTRHRLSPLSHILPMLQNMGLEAVFERAHPVAPLETESEVWVRELRLRAARDEAIDLDRVDAFEELFRLVWRGELEDDGFNRLVLFAALSPQEVRVLRAYARYLRQARAPFGLGTLTRALYSQPTITRRLVDLFLARFDPDLFASEEVESMPAREQACERLRREIRTALDDVPDVDTDRILRRFLNVIDSTLRTTYFQLNESGKSKPYIAFKLDSRELKGLPEPRPWCEIWVHSPSMEAVHLRAGAVSRGGIRWSDRRVDFRTEVLGLMKAQRVKNSVIVAEGAKGGFVVKRLPSDSEAARDQVVAAYRSMISALLDLTDNLVDGEVVPPDHVVRFDGDDPYLVVAADKGTATFSDIANEIAQERGFWLDDAFASGGSTGYDHKKMGITARGAWESVRWHFRGMGRDPQTDEFTVVGIGDMSGDVFGNGMLLSDKIRLVGAFNHQHIFLDPEPDAAASFAERQRLFALPRSSWDDYDRTKISSGGGVYSRTAKTIEVTPQVAERFGLEPGPITPSELAQSLLRAEVDLLWFGGIGTYVKASEESNESVGDHANDALRIDATDVRASVVAEGANLGLTQRGRVECALRGCRINTDFIDNSAGVDTSDHEVNLKILLNQDIAEGRLDREQRDRLLREMEEEVAQLVLRDNLLQNQALSVIERYPGRSLGQVWRVMRTLSREGQLDRQLEELPTDETLEERRRIGSSFVRPELAILLGYAKIDLFRSLRDASLLEDECTARYLRSYFPSQLASSPSVDSHPLRAEILATVLSNEIVNRGGLGLAQELAQKSGRPKHDVALAYCGAREILDVDALWNRVEAQDIEPDRLMAMLDDCGRLLADGATWLLRQEGNGSVVRWVHSCRAPARILRDELPGLVAPRVAAEIESETRLAVEAGVDPELASQMSRAKRLASSLDVLPLAAERGLPVAPTARIYFEIGERLGLEGILLAARALHPNGPWEGLALESMSQDLIAGQAKLAARVLDSQPRDRIEETDAVELVENWRDSEGDQFAEVERLFAEARSGGVDLGLVTVLVRALEQLVA